MIKQTISVITKVVALVMLVFISYTVIDTNSMVKHTQNKLNNTIDSLELSMVTLNDSIATLNGSIASKDSTITVLRVENKKRIATTKCDKYVNGTVLDLFKMKQDYRLTKATYGVTEMKLN